ncbi:uncharacterized protein CMC5_000620 [Chondromyces crocatus]|uniref:Uncharacterized protein n=1 Tax=Chondromyces crocatus TaxID=52 RepID=A0A0K1E4Z2_CHOCO|nr:uncharacterized protein CMC5_000620 [Chondromyces crocatus]
MSGKAAPSRRGSKANVQAQGESVAPAVTETSSGRKAGSRKETPSQRGAATSRRAASSRVAASSPVATSPVASRATRSRAGAKPSVERAPEKAPTTPVRATPVRAPAARKAAPAKAPAQKVAPSARGGRQDFEGPLAWRSNRPARPVAETLTALENARSIEEAIAVAQLALPKADLPRASAWRQQVLDRARERFYVVEAHLKESFGLSLPRHVAVAAAFFQACDEHEQKGLVRLGRRPGLVLRWFEEGGLARPIRSGLDERLQDRYRRDPAEFVTLMIGNIDGLHYGLWFDEPSSLPTTIARTYAFGSGEVIGGEFQTLLPALRLDVQEGLRAGWEIGPAEFLDRARKYLPLTEAIDWFLPHEEAAVAEDKLPSFVKRPDINGGLGPLLPRTAGDGATHPKECESRWAALQAGKTEAYISEARRGLVSGKSAFALVLGRELLFLGDDATRSATLQLLTDAYERMGRKALAAITRVVHAHRDAEVLDVYE